MAKKPSKKGLGRGLSALMADIETNAPKQDAIISEDQSNVAAHCPIEQVHPNPAQPRRTFKQEDLDSLTASIAEKGIIQPIIVRPQPKARGHFQIVAGERRWRAAQQAKLHTVPIIVREMADLEVLEIALIENIQRSDLNAIEESIGYRQLMDKFGHTQEQLSKALGKSRSYIANSLRLLMLPAAVIKMVEQEKLSAGHARALITSKDPLGLAEVVVSKGLSVRQTEVLAKSSLTKDSPKSRQNTVAEKDADTRSLEGDLSAALKMKVAIDHKKDGAGGQVTIAYKTLDQLDELCKIISGS